MIESPTNARTTTDAKAPTTIGNGGTMVSRDRTKVANRAINREINSTVKIREINNTVKIIAAMSKAGANSEVAKARPIKAKARSIKTVGEPIANIATLILPACAPVNEAQTNGITPVLNRQKIAAMQPAPQAAFA